MRHVLVIQHVSREHPGFILDVIRECGHTYECIDFQKGHALPENISMYDILVVLGGGDHVYDDTDQIRAEIAFVRAWLESGKPYFGICLGMQLMVAALGGRVYKSEATEIGFRHRDGRLYEMKRTHVGMSSPLFVHIKETRLPAFHLHKDTVDLPDTIDLLATGNVCKNQIIGYNNVAFGTQGHFELTEHMLEQWLISDPLLATVDKEEVKKDYDAVGEKYEQLGTQMFKNILCDV